MADGMAVKKFRSKSRYSRLSSSDTNALGSTDRMWLYDSTKCTRFMLWNASDGTKVIKFLSKLMALMRVVWLNRCCGNSSMLFWLRSTFSKCVLNAWKVTSFSLVNKLSLNDNILKSLRCSSMIVGNTDNKFLEISSVSKVFGSVFNPMCCIRLELKSSHTSFLSLEKVLYDCCSLLDVAGSGTGWCIWISAGNEDKADVE